jgi:pyruvate/2-oxoacid:ferredoxin oxidoreductase beta subunit
MSSPIRPHPSAPCPSQYSAARAYLGSRFTSTPEAVPEPPQTSMGLAQKHYPKGKARVTQMQLYKRLIELIVQYLMKEGFTFIEAYEQVLAIGRLNPHTTASQIRLNNPSIDRESFLEFKAYNASIRLKRRYGKVLAAAIA